MSHLQIFFYSNSFLCLNVPETTKCLPSVLFCRKMLTLLLFGHKINLFIIYICLFSTLGCFFFSIYISYCVFESLIFCFNFSQGRLLSWPNGLVACPFWCSSINLYYNIVVYSSHQINKFFFFLI